MALSAENPFYIGEGAQLDAGRFAGRWQLREQFCNMVGWGEDGAQKARFGPAHQVWVIEGGRGYGKSAFGAWCEAFPKKLGVVGEKAIVVRVSASMERHEGDAFPALLQQVYDAIWKKEREYRRTHNTKALGERIANLHRWARETRVYQMLANLSAMILGSEPPFPELRGNLKLAGFISRLMEGTKDIARLQSVVVVVDDLGDYEEFSANKGGGMARVRKKGLALWKTISCVS